MAVYPIDPFTQDPSEVNEVALAAILEANTAKDAEHDMTRAERLDRLGSDQALTRLRQIRDTAETATTAELRLAVKDLARWLIEASKVLAGRDTDPVE